MCPQNAQNAISGTQILKPSLANSSLYGILHGGWQGENGPFGNLLHPD